MGFEGASEKIGIVGELWTFMKVRKKWWLGPIVVMLGLLGLLVVFTSGSAVAPFIYTLF
jgi:xanthosine utilization system XapX-like protein